ncbi:MAG: pyrimidine 5'-nucleotidase [Anaerolineae bacterium]|jgi:putative hydrolase of the HAD superfamily|nr:pyrimidine 5'-nucleotidase [Anaerolineae bacterium]MBT7073317.1 pyrimidine 5'-nucleotidase [Anaerolineae bacterium]MBT7782224.1 pyrimidine 5'-nucleotidase [Anaerolineae bacterium]
MTYTTIFFDLDDTLYPHESGLWQGIKDRISLYMHEELGFSWDEIPARREEYFLTYGTTLRGIQANYDVNEDAYHAYVHQLPLEKYIAPDPNLRALLERLPQKKIIFTSADAKHAQRVLAHLEISEYFEQILDIYAIAPYAKPQPESFANAMKLVGESDPSTCVMIDDLPRTTRAAKDFGLFSILKGNKGKPEDADAKLNNWDELPALLHLG